MGDTKLKEAALEYSKDAYHADMPFTSALQAFLAGAAYRDPEIKALLEIVKLAVEALEFYSKIENFEKVVWQDEDKSGPCEPYDFDENELVERYWDGCLGDFGIKAEEALAEIRKLIGDEKQTTKGE